jgi:hypothetical protein
VQGDMNACISAVASIDCSSYDAQKGPVTPEACRGIFQVSP